MARADGGGVQTASPRVRPARLDELDVIAALKRQVETATYAGLGSADELKRRLAGRCSVEFLLSCLEAGDAVFVAEGGEHLMAVGAVRVHGTSPVTAHLHSLYCATRYRGVGRAVTRTRLQWAAERGATSLTADCLSGNDGAAVHLTRLSLVEVERTPSADFAAAEVRHFRGELAAALQRVTAVVPAGAEAAVAAA